MTRRTELSPTNSTTKLLKEIECLHCGHRWYPNPRMQALPSRCPNCGNSWNREPIRAKRRITKDMQYAMFTWVTDGKAGKYERHDDKAFASHNACVTAYKAQCTTWADNGTQFKIKRVR